MMILSKTDLDVYGVRATARTMTFMGKTFVPGQSFAKRLKATAIAIAQQNIERGRPSFLVDLETHITVWTQYQVRQSGHSSPNSRPVRKEQQDAPALAKQERLKAEDSRPASHLKYRGHAIAAPQQSRPSDAAALTDNLTYRGRTVTSSGADDDSETSDWTVLNGQYSARSEYPSTAQRLMQYRGQWVNPDAD